MALDPPKFLFLVTNQRCNLKCQHCTFWKLDDKDKDSYLSWKRRREVLHEFAGMSPGAAVVIAGGESMLDLEDYFAITKECRTLQLRCISIVNGTRILDAETAERMITEGPSEISISLNSHREELHDETRGVRGAFAKSVNALRMMVAARKRLTAPTKIYVMGLIFEQNYRELDAFYDFVLNDVGADKLKLNFLQPTFGGAKLDMFYAINRIRDYDGLVEIIKTCAEKYNIATNPAWLDNVRMYFHSVEGDPNALRGWDGAGTEEHICNTYERNIMLDTYGVARLCYALSYPGVPIRKPGDLRDFWYRSAEPIRESMRTCKNYCGIGHCVRKEPATITYRGPSRDALRRG
jgi:MoaA/NifB/PqqE/SkfB family radical SAM enzyme